MLAVLRQRNFALLWGGQLISASGDFLLFMAVPFYIYGLTGSALATGASFIVNTVPRLLFGSVAGVYVDRWDRRRTMIAADLLRAALLLSLLLVRSAEWIPLIYVVSFVQSSVSQLFLPAKSAIIPRVVGERDLVRANALSALSDDITRLAAPALGGALYSLFGLPVVVLLDSGSYLVSAACLALMALPALTRAVGGAARAATSVGREWRDGLGVIRRDGVIAAIFLAMGTAMVAEGLVNVLIVPFTRNVLHGDAGKFGLLVSAQSIGGIVGGLTLGRVGGKIAPARMIGLSGIALGCADFGLFVVPQHTQLPRLLVGMAFIACAGFPIVGFYVGLTTLLQRVAPDAYRGRIFGAFGANRALLMLAGQAVGSAFGDRVGAVPLMVAGACFDMLSGVLALALLRRVPPVDASAPHAPVASGELKGVSS